MCVLEKLLLVCSQGLLRLLRGRSLLECAVAYLVAPIAVAPFFIHCMKSFTIVKYKYKLRKGCERVQNQDTNNDQKKLYDATCKQVLSEKSLIAYILQTCLDEFRGYSLRYIVRHCIQGTPDVGTVVVEADNGGSFRIKNQQTEDKTETEGTVFYDIRFTAIVPNNGKLIELIINIEAQNDFNPGYPLLKRAVYYCSRMISSQYGSVFTKSHYEKSRRSTPYGSVPIPRKNGPTVSRVTKCKNTTS